ncbi:glycerol-3-phosphate dehydrogenase [NAD(P)+] [Alicyclobacillus cellulosilyticus]|uniref:Glycerol-3-phosphate dehydrogenase [NAD(P)+] n=1 Tax=Alicyclobacillus cellulosilyticus TaxID=1003997 RepID=A0A917KDL2_9BACL|nr:NAD(P)H-dependent glycerol-3-phosphate dehydrogenase [Alicyclobacillus cellulosilyticus]GGJ10256.1 glycerol-3-phosphate dehydrogenase [NAD(P)+] [Alicyclobacillus cellulosilyticus]
MRIAVLGAGSWGTAIATLLSRNGHDVRLWGRQSAAVDDINFRHENHRYLPGVRLPDQLLATTDLAWALAGAQTVFFVVPSTAMREVSRQAARFIPADALLVHAVKGFDVASGQRMSEVLQEETGWDTRRMAVVSGPSHAEEVVRGYPTTVVVASVCQETAETVQDVLMSATFRVYTNPDVVGAELGGSLKNIIAIGVGIADGLGYGDNAKAALMTRGLAEIARLGIKMGASPWTFAGLAGVGDLIVTCTSRHSRNFRAGRLLASGLSLADAMNEVGMAVEGVPATKVAVALAARHEVDMPITQATYDVLFGGKSPQDAVKELMGRPRAHEVEDVAVPLYARWLS